MKKTFLTINLIFSAVLLMSQSNISPGLFEQITKAQQEGTTVEAMIFLKNRYDTKVLDNELTTQKATPHERAVRVINELQQHAKHSQASLVKFLKSKRADEVIRFNTFWVTNVIFIEALPGVILELADHRDIEKIEADEPVELIKPLATLQMPDQTPGMAEPGLKVINAHKMWELGIDGDGVILANLDSGVDGNHPALQDSWHGNIVPPEHAWFDTYYGTTMPTDEYGHGTHTMGTMIGLDNNNSDTIGVAFGADWIAARVAGNFSNSYWIAGLEWFLDPDGDPYTTEDMPAVVSNSWGYDNPCSEAFLDAINNLETAGIAVIFCAGNLGPESGTINNPADLNYTDISVFSVGAIYALDTLLPIASFSSRGPTYCTTGTGDSIKPEVVAPGVLVRSSVPDSLYAYYAGTSMSAPHVAGAVALLKQAFPDKTGNELKQMLYENAHDLGAPGEDNVYGNGVIDVYQAYIANRHPDNPKPPENLYAYSDYQTPNSVELTWADPEELVGGGTLDNFEIQVWRDGVFIASVPSGEESYTNTGLVDGQNYEYELAAKDLDSDSLSIGVSSSCCCGGSPVPSTPFNFNESFDITTGVTLTWADPITQSDGTPLDDLDKIYIFRDQQWIAEVDPGTELYTDNNSLNYNTTHFYCLKAVDTETPQNQSEASERVSCYLGDHPNILVWVGETATGPTLAHGDSIFYAISNTIPEVCIATDLFKFGDSLDMYDAIFVVLGTMPYNHILREHGIDLRSYLFGGGNLYLEGGYCFDFDIAFGAYNIRPWFSLDPDMTRKNRTNVYWVDGINGLGEVQNLQVTGTNPMMDDIRPISSTPIMLNHDTGDTLGVWWDGYGPGNARTIASVPAFGSLVDTSGSGYKDLLMRRYLEFFGLIVDIEEVHIADHFLEVYPNPCSSIAYLRYLIRDSGYLISDLYGIDGRRIGRIIEEEKIPGMYEVEVDVNNLPAGVYFIRMQAGNDVVMRKLVVSGR